MLRQLSRNTLSLLANNLSTAILSFLLTVLVGRGLGEKGLGQYATIMAWIFPLTMLADFGVSTFITRDVAQDHNLAQGYMRQALKMRLIWGGGLVIFIWLIAPYLSTDQRVVAGLRIGIWLILIDSTFAIYTAVWRARQNMLLIWVLNGGLLTAQVIGTALAIALDAGIKGVFLALVLADVGQLITTWFIWQRWDAGSPASNSIVTPSIGDFMRKAWQFALASILAAIQARMIFLLLETFGTTQMVGWYAAASRFVEAAKMPPFALFGALFPAMSALVRDQSRLLRTIRQTNLGLAGYGLIVALGFTLLGKPLLQVTLGDTFSRAVPILMVLGWSLIPALLRQNAILLFYARHQEQWINQVMLVVAIIQFLLANLLIRAEQVQGAALTILLSEILFLLILCRWVWLIPLLLVILGWIIRQELLDGLGFDGLYGQDAFAYFNYGVKVRDAVQQLQIPSAMYWGLGFPVLLAISFFIQGAEPQTAQLLVLGIGALIGGTTFALVYDLLRFVQWTRRGAILAGLTAGLLMTFSGQVLQSSLVIMADVPALFWAILSAWCLVRYAISGSPYWIMAASVTLAMAGITRWAYFLLAIPWGICCLQVWGGRVRWRETGLAVLAGGVILVVQIAHSSQNPDSLIGHDWLQSWSPENAFQRDFLTSDGTFHYQHPVAEFYAHAAWDGFYNHRIFLPLMILGGGLLLWDRRRYAFALILLFGWLILNYGFLAGIPYQNIRFSLAFFLPLAVFAGIGLAGLWQMLDRIPALGWAVQGWIIVGMVAALYTTYQAGQHEIERITQIKTADLAAIQWADEQIPEAQADVYTLDLWLMMKQYAPRLNALQIYYETPESLAARLSAERPTYLLLNLWAIENQWVGKDPWLAYHWLDENPGLSYTGRHGNYHLLRVNSP
jgi:O-antigen/teichoic acid export membrane protein